MMAYFDKQMADILPAVTYEIDFENKRILRNKITDDSAVRQCVRKAINTPRAYFIAYSVEYGCDILKILQATGVTPEYYDTEIPRMIIECIENDDRVVSCTVEEYERSSESVVAKVLVTTIYGTTEASEVNLYV